MDKVLNTRIKHTVVLEERLDSQRLNTVNIMLNRGRLDLNDESRMGMLLANIQDRSNPRFATVYERKLFKYKGEWHSIGRMPPKIKSGGSNQLKSGMCATLMQQDLRNLLYMGCIDLDQICAVQRIACDIFKHFDIYHTRLWLRRVRQSLENLRIVVNYRFWTRCGVVFFSSRTSPRTSNNKSTLGRV